VIDAVNNTMKFKLRRTINK